MIDGFCEREFSGVRRVFERVLTRGSAGGASIGVYHDGREVVRLWGGLVDPETGRRWAGDTLVQVASLGKVTATAALLHLMSERGIGLDEAVSSHWPAFAQNGKAAITIRQVLSHTAGLPLMTESLTRERALAIHRVFARLGRHRRPDGAHEELTSGWRWSLPPPPRLGVPDTQD